MSEKHIGYDAFWKDFEERNAARKTAEAVAQPNVVQLIPKDQRKPATRDDGTKPWHIIIGEGVIDVLKKRGEDIMITEKAAYLYKNGLWTIADGLNTQLNVEIERAAQAVGQPSTNKLISEARGWILRQKKLFRKHDEIRWDAHGMVPTRSGLVDPRTHEIRPIRPNDYCTWIVEAEYDPEAKCPWWLQMLDDVFSDKTEDERGKTICVIQELLGAGLLDEKPRPLQRALIFQGGSNFGKSGLLEVLGGLFGREVNSTPIDSLEATHGMMQFIRRRPWVLHEAFDQRKWHFSSNVKAIVTGDPVQVNVKNGAIWSLRINAPIFWGTNHPPKFKESTRAITNRLVVIECKREFFEEHPVGTAIKANELGLDKPSSLVLQDEMPGVLAWAMVGLKRALERGRLLLTTSMTDTIDEIRKDANLVAGFLDECVEYDSDWMVSRADFCLAFSAWWQAEKGETYSPPSNEIIGKAVVAMNDPLIATGSDLKDKYNRYFAGITLSVEGLSYHHAGAESRHLEAKKANTSNPLHSDGVNQRIPVSWLTKPEIKAMQDRALHPPPPPGWVADQEPKF